MYYRRKLLLALIEANGGAINKTRLQKLLLLVTRYQEKKTYDFVPYQFGCYSFTANQDLNTLTKYDLVKHEQTENGSAWVKKTDSSFLSELKEKDKHAIMHVTKMFSKVSNDDLIKYTYKKYPYWAINSTIANKLMSKPELQEIRKQKRSFQEKGLFTIGYEGLSLESYINKLIINGVEVLCDVRKNSLSMKYGFSKSQLKHACEGVGIKFLHIPELGIVSDKRRELNTMRDYNKLFTEYEKTTLRENDESVSKLIGLINNSNRRVAITCFEKDVCMCHRGRVAKKVMDRDNTIPVRHL